MALPANGSIASGSLPPGMTSTPLTLPVGMLREANNLNNPSIAEFVARRGTPNPTADATAFTAATGATGAGAGAGGSITPFRHETPPAIVWSQRVNTVLQLLRSRVVGRGVSREAVVRLGKLEGFDCLWQGNDLTIAGNEVDLEIEFGDGSGGDSQKECAKDVRLRYASVDVEDDGQDIVMTDQTATTDNNVPKHSSTSATAALVMKRNLMASSANKNPLEPWQPLDAFHANLQRLAAFDRLSKHVPCFPAIDGLYDGAFRRIWDEFLKLEPPVSSGTYQQMCKSPCGRPGMNTQDRVGLNLQYWVDRGILLDLKEANQGDDEPGIDSNIYTYNATIECEEGFPSLRNSKNWISETEPFLIPEGQNRIDRLDAGTIKWLEPESMLPTAQTSPGTDNHPIIPTSVRFVAHLHPPLVMPLRVAADMYSRSLEQEFLVSNASVGVWDELVVPPISQQDQTKEEQRSRPTGAVVNEPSPRGRPCVKVVPIPNENGADIPVQHEYSFHAIEQTMGCKVDSLPFSHPRQIVEVIPILRQYAMVNGLLQRVFESGEGSDAPKGAPSHTHVQDKDEGKDEEFIKPGFITNIDSVQIKLDSIMDANDELDELFMSDMEVVDENEDTTRKVNVSVHMTETGAPVITLMVKTPNTGDSDPVFVIVNVGLHGKAEVLDVHGSRTVEEDKASLKEDLTRILRKSEDLGMLVEFILKKI